ncbi:hypothetical protein [Nocardia abscessus]|uniref:hypothetical protein n=1 Tax=Nocardia abscessus TaxID=120957 RepID=UPI0024551C51|nr:hypothetical protein [Nocardia abscessus]
MTRRPVRRDRIEERAADNVDIIEFRAAATEAINSVKWSEGVEPPTIEQLSCWIDGLAYSDLVGGPVALDWLKTVSDRLEFTGPVLPARMEVARKLAQIRLGIGAKHKRDGLIWCEWHGYTEPLGFQGCAACPCEMPTGRVFGLDKIGRPRRHCTNACRQRAYRRRLRDRLA